jgi:predicted phosphodiesterase
MKISVIYDIHANFPVLEAVLNDAIGNGSDLIVVGGDVIPGPMPVETLDCLTNLEIPVLYLMGNGEREVLAALDGSETKTLPKKALEDIRWNAQHLLSRQIEFIKTWPKTLGLTIPNHGNVLFCHATPQSDTPIFTRLTADDKLLPIFEEVDESIIVCGHTHMQFERVLGKKLIVNAVI